MTAATDGDITTIDMGGSFPSNRLIQAGMMPQAPTANRLPAPWHGHLGAGGHLRHGFCHAAVQLHPDGE
jgi:hypothetical protein